MSRLHNGAPVLEGDAYATTFNGDVHNIGPIGISLLLGLYIVHQILSYFELSARSLVELPFQLAWYILVLMTPSRVLEILDSEFQNPRSADADQTLSAHALKSESILRILEYRKPSVLKAGPINAPLKGLRTVLKPDVALAPPGLGNWDNSCYQNSVIQGLATLNSFRSYLENSQTDKDELSTETTTGALLDMIRKLNKPSKQGFYIWTPRKLKSMSSFQQQDAQEYFSKILDEIEKEAKKILKERIDCTGLKEISSLSEGNGPRPDRDSTDNSNLSTLESKESRAQNPLDGLLAQRVGCTECGYSEGISLIPFNCITVTLGQSWSYDIRTCLDEFTQLEIVNGVDCAKCTLKKRKEDLERFFQDQCSEEAGGPSQLHDAIKERLNIVSGAIDDEDFSDDTIVKKCQIPKKSWVSSDKSKQAVIARAPQSLVIHVNRSVFDEYTGQLKKNYADVQFKPLMDFSPWCLGNQSSAGATTEMEMWPMTPTQSLLSRSTSVRHKSVQYKLTGLITHYGRHENGHYVCYRKFLSPASTKDESEEENLELETWWRLSDHQVISVSESDVLQQGGVFMLFYERVYQESPEDLKTSRGQDEKDVDATQSLPATEETENLPLDEKPDSPKE